MLFNQFLLTSWKNIYPCRKVAVEDNFSAAMQEAILQSKLDFEEQKEAEARRQELLATGQGSQEVMDSLDKEDRKKVVKLQKKLNTMTLEQFNNASVVKDTLTSNGDKVQDHSVINMVFSIELPLLSGCIPPKAKKP